LLLKLPTEKLAGKRIDARVALADVAPTLLKAADIAVPASMQGQSLFSLIDAPEVDAAKINAAQPAGRSVYSETEYAHRTLGWSELRSWRAGKYLYVQAPRKELYDQTSDPTALRNIAPSAKAVANTLDAQLSDFRQKTSSSRVEEAQFDPSQAESLNALGYLASDGGKENRIENPLVDPKDKVEIVNLLQEAIIAIEENRYEDAMAIVHRVVRDPDAVNAYMEFGIDMVRHKRYQDAVPLLRKAVEKLPNSAGAHYEFGLALINTGQWEAALPQIQAAVLLKPDSASLHFTLAAVNTKLKRVQEAMAECEKALEIDPEHFDANLTYGRLLLQEGRPDAALPRLMQAVKVKPDSAESHFFLGEAYQRLGQIENATRERDRAAELKAQSPSSIPQ
jgi:tetratricopeptide (TPR) repeat protein